MSASDLLGGLGLGSVLKLNAKHKGSDCGYMVLFQMESLFNYTQFIDQSKS